MDAIRAGDDGWDATVPDRWLLLIHQLPAEPAMIALKCNLRQASATVPPVLARKVRTVSLCASRQSPQRPCWAVERSGSRVGSGFYSSA
jgi:hypothetical protein